MLQKTKAYMEQHGMIAPGEKIVLGLSGGADSVCLFHILKQSGYSLEAVHVNHGIRGKEADRDEAFVKALCEKESVPFHSFHFPVLQIAEECRLSVEEAGRTVRRQAFLEVMEKTGAQKIALAHHGNDRTETFLFHLCRGTGVRGLAALKPVEGNVIRPLLWTGRKEILQFLEAHQYEFVEDGTNSSCKYTRNRIRHEVIPLLEEIHPKAAEHICSAAGKLQDVWSYIDREAQKLCLLSAVCDQKEVHIMKYAFCKSDPVLRIPALQKCVEYLSGSLANITEEHWNMLLSLFEMQTGKEVHLPYGITAVRTYEGIKMYFRKEKQEKTPLEISGEGVYEFGGLTFKVSVEAWDDGKIFPIKNYTKCFDYDKISGSVFLRTRRSGDYLEINREHQKKSLQDYLVNEKVPKDQRDQVVLLAEGSHVLWAAGMRISEYYKVSKDTKKVLKVQMCGGNGYE